MSHLSPALPRRAILFLGASILVACKRQDRCKSCGMVNDPTSRFRVEIRGANGAVERFDTPKCAFKAHRTGTTGEIFALGYYTQTMRPAAELSFAAGSDVLGPMGIDFVPVERELAKRFASEHGAKQLHEAEAITLQVIQDLS